MALCLGDNSSVALDRANEEAPIWHQGRAQRIPVSMRREYHTYQIPQLCSSGDVIQSALSSDESCTMHPPRQPIAYFATYDPGGERFSRPEV